MHFWELPTFYNNQQNPFSYFSFENILNKTTKQKLALPFINCF
jgi:hypothetical protein